MSIKDNKADKKGYEDFYKVAARKVEYLETINSSNDYINYFENKVIKPFYDGGYLKGYIRSKAINTLIAAADKTGKVRQEITIVDAGCGLGGLSLYLAAIGFDVIGVDISAEGCQKAAELSGKIGVSNKVRFLAESLEKTSIHSSSVDFIIGHNSLHHFIKYEKVPYEFNRIMKNNAQGFFTDSFGENILYRLFHDKEKMQRLGDVILNKKIIDQFFKQFDIDIIPVDWLVMLDKIYIKIFPLKIARALSRINFLIDRKIPNNRFFLFLSGAIITTIQKH